MVKICKYDKTENSFKFKFFNLWYLSMVLALLKDSND